MTSISSTTLVTAAALLTTTTMIAATLSSAISTTVMMTTPALLTPTILVRFVPIASMTIVLCLARKSLNRLILDVVELNNCIPLFQSTICYR